MPEDGSALRRQQDDRKYLSKHHWRNKIFTTDEALAKDASQKFKVEEDVMNFLRPSVNRPQPNQLPSHPAPRIDTSTAKRWPAASEVEVPNLLAPNRPRTNSRGRSWSPKRSKKGLNVKFSNAQPEIIGEGGDEADSPPQDVSNRRAMSHSPSLRGSNTIDTRGAIAGGAVNQDSSHQENFRPGPLRRAPTGFENVKDDLHENAQLLSSDNLRQDGNIQTLGNGDRPTMGMETGEHHSFDRTSYAKMRAEEGALLHQAKRPPSPPPKKELLQPPTLAAPSYPPASPLATPFNDFGPPSTYSLRPTPSTEPLSQNYFPNSLPPEYTQQSPPQPSAPMANSTVQPVPILTTSAKPPSYSLRTAATAVADNALEDFSERVQHFNKLFHLAAEAVKPIPETAFSEWIRAATWWFLKGRGELETAIRNRPQGDSRQEPTQAYVNLAKAWWIAEHVTPQHSEPRRYGNGALSTLATIARNVGDESMADLIETHQQIVTQLRALTMSMKRNSFLPPRQDQAPLFHGLDTSIWVQYPYFTPDVSTMLSGKASKSMVLETPTPSKGLSEIMPLGDSKRHFTYGRTFVFVSLSSDEDESNEFVLPCILSTIRERDDWQMKATIASQNGLVNLSIQANKKVGPTWNDVRWRVRENSMQVKLPRGFELNIQFSDRDFKSVWGMYEHTQKVERSLQPEPGETLVFENTVKNFQCIAGSSESSFPSEPIKRCRIRLFEQKVTRVEGTGERHLHRGFRLIVVTSPKVKKLSSINQELGKQKAILYGNLRGEDGAPALFLKTIQGKDKQSTMVLTFHETSERAGLYGLLVGTAIGIEESSVSDIPLKSFSLELRSQAEGFSQSAHNALGFFGWQRLRVINKDPEPDRETAKTVLSESLRICGEGKAGAITDRINLGPGELQLRLAASSSNEIIILRPAQEDFVAAIAENLVPSDVPNAIEDLTRTMSTAETVRTYGFHTLQDLHSFQLAITDFAVTFDGLSSIFAISRRRMVVPIYKRWEATHSRLQILRQENTNTVQLVAFFQDFSHGDCMNFHLKSTDVFEAFGKSGKFFIRIVDAKFALPKIAGGGNEGGAGGGGRAFVCLDLPEYAGEHDDITIGFDCVEG
ncbi:MAG: hypothetical protein M1812_006708 [Candelaria pacifica]|nr:MAG: hypothetical protein M1812_006708 [Candelaria pacifica]